MIKKLEQNIPIDKIYGGEKMTVGQRPPNNEEITNKINEIIDYINKKENIHYLL